jgi:hypothetical protein
MPDRVIGGHRKDRCAACGAPISRVATRCQPCAAYASHGHKPGVLILMRITEWREDEHGRYREIEQAEA